MNLLVSGGLGTKCELEGVEISWLQDNVDDRASLIFLKRVGRMNKVAGDDYEMTGLVQRIRRSRGLSLGRLTGEAAMAFGIVATFS